MGAGAAPPAAPIAEDLGRSEGSDDSLICRAADDDQAAWRTLVARHLSSVVGHAWYMLNDRTEAEDVAQEVFLRLMKKLDRWQPGAATLRTWLYRVATNLCIDRRRHYRPESLSELEERFEPRTGCAAVDRELDLVRTVAGALQQLPARQRAAVALVHYQGFTNGEAAALLCVSVDALESLLARGRGTLRRELQPVAPDLLGDRP